MKNKNPVAKYLRQFNKAVTHKDRKKAYKNGYQKHKSRFGGVCALWNYKRVGFGIEMVIGIRIYGYSYLNN